jgi:hypothetical protein
MRIQDLFTNSAGGTSLTSAIVFFCDISQLVRP